MGITRTRTTVLAAIGALALAGLPATAADAAPPGGAKPGWKTRVVQLGDSYSSGNGAGTYTETDCYRSPLNYGEQVAAEIGAAYVNVACGGAVVADLLEPRALGAATSRTATYDVGDAADPRAAWLAQAQEAQLCGTPAQGDYYHTYTLASFASAGSSATGTVRCQLMTKAQVEAVNPSTDLVFLTIGGNDIGFSNLVAQCMVLRSAAGCKTAVDNAEAKLPTMRDDLLEALLEIDQRSKGRAQVYLLSYPFLMNTDSYGIPEAAPAYDAGRALHDLQLLGDELQQQVMDEANAATGSDRFVFVDSVKDVWGGHTHGLDPRVAPDNSQAWLVPPFAPGRVLAEWVHPTQRGWTAMAEALQQELRVTSPGRSHGKGKGRRAA